MKIRPYRDADLDSVVQLFTESVHAVAAAHYDSIQCAAWAPEKPDLHAWRDRLSSLHVLVAEKGGQLAGFIGYEQDGHIDLLYTSPLFTRRGVASVLYQHVEFALESAGVGELFTEASLAARPFFERHGFTVTEEQIVERRGVSFRRFAMRKALAPVTPRG